MKYWAFISYSGRDEHWAKWLHRNIESYVVPKALALPSSVDLEKSRRLRPVFLDRDELPSASSLNTRLIWALAESHFLIVVCSPRSAKSEYVNQEIREFLKVASRDRILCVIVEGEPNVSPTHAPTENEAFAAPLRFDVLSDGTLGPKLADVPLAADARATKDGKARALLKVIAGMLGVGLDDLVRREHAQRQQRLLTRVGVALATLVIGLFGYVAMADLDYQIPGGSAIRDVLDQRGKTLFRPIPDTREILETSRRHRLALVDALLSSRTRASNKLFSHQIDSDLPERWSTSQILASLARSPELTAANARLAVEAFAEMFSDKILLKVSGMPAGWVDKTIESPQGEIAAWMLAAIGQMMARSDITADDLERLRDYATQTVGFLERHRGTAGWAMYPSVRNREFENFYTTTLAMQAFLHLSQAGGYTENDRVAQRARIQSTARWLIAGFNATANPAGWKAEPNDTIQGTLDGLSFQIYSQVLRAQTAVGIDVPKALSDSMTAALISCTDRNLDYPVTSKEFWSKETRNGMEVDVQESITFHWYPWAIESAAWWLAGPSYERATTLERNRVRRALGHLVNNLGPKAVATYTSGRTYMTAELLYALASLEVLVPLSRN